jgi:Tol biopolymer transport system component
MPDTKQLLRDTRDRVAPPTDVFEGLDRRRRHKEHVKRTSAAVIGIAVALAGMGWWIAAGRNGTQPAVDRSDELGIFAPVAGRIVYENGGSDGGYAPGFWAVDPSGPSDTVPGPTVADDAASTLVPLELDGAPLGWSSEGTELLFMRSDGALIPQEDLYIHHADGSENRLNVDPMYFGGAAISPDGSRVVFGGQGDVVGLYVVDVEGGRPVPLPIPQAEEGAGTPRFSPDGTQIVYLAGNGEAEVWVANADGTGAHEILADEPTVFLGITGLEWSPAGDRLAIGVGDHEGGGRPAIYTFAPDGSDFTQVITGGISPYWSPDGTQIAYTIPCDEHPDAGSCPEGSIRRSEFDPELGDLPAGLAIADADGSNVRAFGFAASGPWHPGVSTPESADAARTEGEVG